MKWKISYLAEENIIYTETEGEMNVESLNAMAKEINEAIGKYGSTLLLMDHRKVILQLSAVDIYDRPKSLKMFGIQKDAKIAEVALKSKLEDFDFFRGSRQK